MERAGFREAHTHDEAMLLYNNLARSQRKTTESHGNSQTKFPSSLQNTPPLPHVESEGTMPALDVWKSLGVKVLHCSITGVRLSYFILPDLKYTWEGGREEANK